MPDLTLAQLTACAQGVDEVFATDAGICFSRLPRSIRDHYAPNRTFDIRARCPAGIVLDFVTDATELSLELTLEEGARAATAVDVWADGQFIGTLATEGPPILKGSFRWSRLSAEAPTRVRVYLPHTRPAALRHLTLPTGSSFTPSPKPLTLLMLGDSITQGMDCQHPSQTYAAVAARELGFSLHNAAIGGHVFGVESLIDPPCREPFAITVAYGTNDWSQCRDIAHARPYLDRVRELYPDAAVFVLEPTFRPNAEAGSTDPARPPLEEYRRRLAGIVESLHGMWLLPAPRLLPAEPRLLVDGLHPTTFGHTVLGHNVATLLAAELPPA